CACRPAAEQLLQMGYFPCAPRRPSIAYSIELLEFLTLHDLRVSPNATAWSSTLQEFWQRRGCQVDEKTQSRKRLSNTIQWYTVLLDRVEAHVDAAVKGQTAAVVRADSGC
ncbi:hypothetical protein AURDEDRAFT_63001, partial [Auricularia subglabra TFB-10046 SS5]